MKRTIIIIIAILCLSLLKIHSQNNFTGISEIDSIFQNQIEEKSPGCVVGVIKDGLFIHKKAYGLANLDYEIPLTTSSVFRIASTSKQFTAACIFLLEKQGKLSLDDDIRNYLKNFPFYGDIIRIRHLVHHTSGLRDYTGLIYLLGVEDDYQYTPNDLYQLIIRQKEPDFKPGEQFCYSNTGYFLLARIVESVAGTSLNEFARANLFAPLHMSNTHFHDNHKMVVKNRAYGYGYNGNAYEISMSNNDVVGDGGIFTTLEDLRKWDENFYSHKVGGVELVEKMTTLGTLNDGSQIPYAGGLYIRNYRGLRKVNHTGSYAGFKSSIAQFPEEKVTIIILANNPNISPPLLSNKIADIILKDKLDPETTPQKREPSIKSKTAENQKIPIEIMKALAGEYYSSELNFKYEIFIEKEKAYCRIGNNKVEQLHLKNKNQLMVDEYVSLNPIWDKATRTVSSFTLSVGDSKNIIFKKINYK